MTINDYIVDKIFKDTDVETLGCSSLILEEDPLVIKNIFKNKESSEKNKILLCLILSSMAYADSVLFYKTLYCWGQRLSSFKLVSSTNEDITYCTYFFEDVVVIAFKGSSTMKDFFYDINTALDATEEIEGKVHRGFYALLTKNETLMKLSRLIEKYPIKTHVIFTGHSLGGALASLMTSHCQNKFGKNRISLYTFGSPRVGDSKFRDSIANCSRIVTSRDPVAYLPFPPRYSHLEKRTLLKVPGMFRFFDLNSHKISAYYKLLSS